MCCLRKLESVRKLESSDKEKKENRDNNKTKHLALLKKEKEKISKKLESMTIRLSMPGRCIHYEWLERLTTTIDTPRKVNDRREIPTVTLQEGLDGVVAFTVIG